jgi:hypothetical protein
MRSTMARAGNFSWGVANEMRCGSELDPAARLTNSSVQGLS